MAVRSHRSWGGWFGGALSAGCLALAARDGGADGTSASLQVQYQSLSQRMTLFRPDGTSFLQELERQTWQQSYEVTQSNRWANQLNMFGQFRWTQVSSPGSPERSYVPYGALRLVHPLFGFIGSYTPSVARGTAAVATGGFSQPTTGAASQVVTARAQETLLSGYLAPRRLPRLDLAWTRRHRDADFLSREETGSSRRAGLTYDLGAWNVHGSYTDLSRAGGLGSQGILQKSYNAGSSLHLNLRRDLFTQLQYDFAQTGLTTRDRSRNHSGTVNATLQRSRRSSWGLFYSVRGTSASTALGGPNLVDHDGSLLYNRQIGRLVRFSGGGGVRTDRSVHPNGNDVLKYLTAVLSAQGDVRPGLLGTASIAHTDNWSPGRAAYAIETGHAGARAHFRKGIDLDADLQVARNSDSLSRENRYTRNGTTALRLQPLRALNATLGGQFVSSGRGILASTSRSRALSLDVRWRLVPSFEVTANVSQAGALPRNDPRVTTQLYSARWSMAKRLEVWGSYSRSSQVRNDVSSTTALSGREIASVRMTGTLGHLWIVNAGYNVADSGRPDQSRQVDASLTKRFGR